ncbi:hypothetical protein FQN50_008290 [Emmonsiellopsis sp. PD_5]|nr:hypothetical protein FQN50_008290 [Emmonsiellopsis sp. PD_5]
MAGPSVGPRHIQDPASAESLIPHWGYPGQVMPCTNDPGSCAYLDAIYWMHDVSMFYTFIMWAVIGGVVLLIFTFRLANTRRSSTAKGELESQRAGKKGSISRAWGAVSATARCWLLPESLVSFFGHVTRLQVVILAVILAYLLIFSLVGIVYKTWITPVKNSTLSNTRTTLGGFSDRIGALAYALTPLTIALSTRENILSLITGIPYQHFNFLHRWTGRIIFVQSVLHTIAWTIVEGKLYQPQPKTYAEFIVQMYMVFGIIAQILITFLYIFSIKRVIKWTGHEFFRKTHYIAGILYLGACWGHWAKLACWMIASIGILFLDRGCRLLRTFAIHFNLKDGNKGPCNLLPSFYIFLSIDLTINLGVGFRAANSKVISFDDGDGGIVVRMELTHEKLAWISGQHFFLCFPELTVWQSHPFTPLPYQLQTHARHVYIIRCLKGETSRLALLPEKSADSTTPVILTGPYGPSILDKTAPNTLAIAGGTGISFALPLAAAAATQPDRRVELVWIIRHARNIEWVQEELNSLLQSFPKNITVRIFITRESPTGTFDRIDELKDARFDDKMSSLSHSRGRATPFVLPQHPNLHISWLDDHHPQMGEILQQFIGDESSSVTIGRVQIVGSGPAGLGRDLRASVAKANDGAQVWKGREQFDVGLYWDNRYF